jgi:hypothetical protein
MVYEEVAKTHKSFCNTCISANCNGVTECKDAKGEPVDTCPTGDEHGFCKNAAVPNTPFTLDIVFYKASDPVAQPGKPSCDVYGGTYSAAP